MPAGDTDESESVATGSGKKEVHKGPPPPPEGHCVQMAADANPPGPPGLANEMESEEADYR